MEGKCLARLQHSSSQSPAMEDLRKLNEFVATLSYGKDLFPSTRSLLTYSFGNRSISELFRSVMVDSQHITECKEISKALCDAAVEAVDSLLLQSEPPRLKSQFPEQLSFFWEVYRIEGIPDLLQPDSLSSLEATLGKISHLVQTAGFDRSILQSLPVEFLLLLNVEPCVPCGQKVTDAGLPHFLKDISHHNMPLEQKTEENYSSMQCYIRRLEKELEKIAAGEIDSGSVKELSEVKFDDRLPFQDATRLGARLTSALDTLERSVEVGSAFCSLLENFFSMLTEDAKVGGKHDVH
ncbi:hypothetical protein Y032_0389g510 [Ancylostoma ceylanicum]|nr:hypothetical protein Y032_0389g510 [Ancylostoma ceylanicum]